MIQYPALVIFCKRPALNYGKQRLASEIGTGAAFEAANLLLECALEDAVSWPGEVILSPEMEENTKWAQLLINTPHTVIPQINSCLGERLMDVDKKARASGSNSNIFIGTDAPFLNQKFYNNAISVLQVNDVVLGPARDGGVTLMGSNNPWPDITNLPWSKPSLGSALGQSCEKAGRSVAWLEQTYDVDFKDDLLKLKIDLINDLRPARQTLLNWINNNQNVF